MKSSVESAHPRRSFLKGVTGGGLALLGSAVAGEGKAAPAPGVPGRLPSISLGTQKISRLVAGGNPIGGYAYSTANLSRFMQEYFTAEQTAEFILHCEEVGITTWQSHYDEKVRKALLLARERGSKIQWIALLSSRTDELAEVLELKPAAVAHHGGVTDSLMLAGKEAQIHDFVKRVHDAGLTAGVSTHSPRNLARLDAAGWENDFFMACFYYLSRTQEELKVVSSEEVLGYSWMRLDPERMAAAIRKVTRPCLAFKILGAGRVCGDRERDPASTEEAFAFAYRNIKPSDGVIVGMFPVYHDEVAENAGYALKYAMPT